MIEVMVPRERIVEALDWCLETQCFAGRYRDEDLEAFKKYWMTDADDNDLHIRFTFPDDRKAQATLFKLTFTGVA